MSGRNSRRKSLSVNISSSKPPKKPISIAKIGKKVLSRKSRRGPDVVELFLTIFLENNDAPYASIDYYLVEKCVRMIAKSKDYTGEVNLFATKKLPMGDLRTLYRMWNREVVLEDWPLHVICAVLKVYLKLQEEPIIPHKFYEHFKQLIADDSKDLERQYRLVKETFKSNAALKWVCALFLFWKDEKKLQTFMVNEMLLELAPYLVNYSESAGGRSSDYFEEFPEFVIHAIDMFAVLFDTAVPDLINGSQSDPSGLLTVSSARSTWMDSSEDLTASEGAFRASTSDSVLSIGEFRSMPTSPVAQRRQTFDESRRWSIDFQHKIEQAKQKVSVDSYWNMPYRPLPDKPANGRRNSVAVMEGDHTAASLDSDLAPLREEKESPREASLIIKSPRSKRMTLLASYKDDTGRAHSKELTALPFTTLADIVAGLKDAPGDNINSITIKIV